ncbi:DegQ family serine endoprotease [Sulfurisoma sediminicola]|uniref:Probable periplasmic serine endoprotease DegP-like n=1 Tax=Sulfurisoma sediminicola TaxID=1381557 RepID=A0A497XJY0_9PROT|nr:DegQ family serine endoprotease [Sulfurisoma sediminicola]RLJ67670.1 serine protease Do [Sulfurisoma sediminicola]
MTSSFRRIAIAAIAVAAIGVAYFNRGDIPLASAHATAAPASISPPPAPHAGLPDFSDIVARYGPAVVNVSTSGTVKARLAEGADDPFAELLRRFGMAPPAGEYRSRGLGSGFIVGADGLVLTNAHVVADAGEIVVRLTDKREFAARLLGLDKATDVAVLKIDARDLPTVRTGNAAATRVGEWVLAIGSPFGFDSTATAGIVSAKSRSLPDDAYVPFIQSDVAVNPGNSGGPLFNANGEVIGINSQIYSRSGGYQGLSFAIPIDVALKVKDQIVAHGHVSRGRLGVTIQELSPALADSFGLARPAGALVSSVEKGSAAERAGIAAGDVIQKFDGHDIAAAADLPPHIAGLKPGTTAAVEVWRRGRVHRIDVAVGAVAEAAPADTGGDRGDKLGLAVRPLTRDERRQAGLPGGLVVEDVAGSGASARAGIEPGDVIIAVNGTPVAAVDQLRAQLERGGKRIALLVQRGDNRLFLPIDLS